MTLGELLDRLWIPIVVAVVLVLGQAAYLVHRSLKLDRSEQRFGEQPAARESIRASRRILIRAAVRALGLVVLLFASVYLLSNL